MHAKTRHVRPYSRINYMMRITSLLRYFVPLVIEIDWFHQISKKII